MKSYAILLLLCLTGCATTVPVVPRFPEPPTHGQGTCPQLQTLVTDAKLSDVAATVTANYSTYYECSVKVDTWNEWYEVQRRIFEGIK
jgi:hypothetical protein